MSDIDTNQLADATTPVTDTPLDAAELDTIAGGAFDPYMGFQPSPNPPPPPKKN